MNFKFPKQKRKAHAFLFCFISNLIIQSASTHRLVPYSIKTVRPIFYCISSSFTVLGFSPVLTNSTTSSNVFTAIYQPYKSFFIFRRLDIRTYVCYNTFGATLFGRRLAFSTGVIACVYIEIHFWKSFEEVCAYAYNGTIYSHYQLMYYLLCSWLFRWV